MRIAKVKVLIAPGESEARVSWENAVPSRPKIPTQAEENALTDALDDLVKRRRHAARAA